MTQDITQLTIPQLVEELYSLRLQLKILESAEKSVLGQLKPLVDPQFDSVEEKTIGILFGELMLSRTSASNSRLDKAMLLEHGIPIDILNLCTKVTPYFTYKITAKSDKK